MKLVIHILANATTLLSLLLFLAITALWIRSYCVGEQIAWRTDSSSWFVTSGHGEVMLVIAQGDAMSRQGQRWNHVLLASFPALPTTGFNMHPLFLGLQSGSSDAASTLVFKSMAMPWWPAVVLSAALTSLFARMTIARWRRNRRKRSGLCPNCHYDLRATPEDQSRYPLNYEARIGAD